MQTYQFWTCLGNTTHDVKVTRTAKGTLMGKFTIASEYERIGQDGESIKDKALFIPCVVFGEKAEFLSRNATKGSLVLVTGRLLEVNWTDNDTKLARGFIQCSCSDVRVIKAARATPSNSYRHTWANDEEESVTR